MKGKVYFKNLNGFRFLAASLVIFSHIELFKKRSGLINAWNKPFYFEAGGMGVDFFFVLSGFLITTLLLKEIEEKGKVELTKFYMRGILRIWPLYYLLLIICYFIIPHLSIFYYPDYSDVIFYSFWSKFLLSFLFLPNAALAFFFEIPYAAPLWSVGVEEQFYIFWPLIIMIFPKRILTISIFILLFISIKAALIAANYLFEINPTTFTQIKDLVVATRMECMGIGGLGAFLIFKNHKIGRFLSSNNAFIIALILLPVVLLSVNSLFEFHHIIYSILFLVIILNGATNQKTYINLENNFFLTLGNISYGLYLWHMLCIGVILNFMLRIYKFKGDELSFNLALYGSTFALSIGVSWLSYRFIEKPFLARKRRYSVITSGSDVREQEKNKLNS